MGTVRHVAGLRFTRGRRRPVQPRAPCALTPRARTAREDAAPHAS